MASFNDVASDLSKDAAQTEFDRRIAEAGVYDPMSAGFRLATREEIDSITFKPTSFGAMIINYHDVYGNFTGFKRFRFLGNIEGHRYYQFPGTGTHAYLPRLIDNWVDEIQDTNKPLLITEGELKAYRACAAGYPTIGLGGVNSFTNKIEGVRKLISPLTLIPPNKTVYIAYDYDGNKFYKGIEDGEPKEEVRAAELTLAHLLKVRGAKVYFLRLGEKGCTFKIGLDDYLNSGQDLTTKIQKAQFFDPSKDDGEVYLHSYYGMMEGTPINVRSGRSLSKDKFQTHEADCTEPFEEGKKQPKSADAFFTNKYKTIIEGLTFEPANKLLITEDNKINTWRGWKTEPHFGDVSRWVDFVNLFFSEEAHLQTHFERVMALMLQKPEVKQSRLPILASGKTGIGKSLYFETIAGVMNNTTNGQSNGDFSPALVTSGSFFNNPFNSQLKGKKFVIFNEIGESGEKHTNMLKDIVSGTSLTISTKYEHDYDIKNLIQFAITTNELFTHVINKESRRELVYRIEEFSPLAYNMRSFFEDKSFFEWLHKPSTRSALLYYYLNMDLDGYTGNEPAPESSGKMEMADSAMGDVAEYFKDELGSIDRADYTNTVDTYAENLDQVKFVIAKEEYIRYLDCPYVLKPLGIGRFSSQLKARGFSYLNHWAPHNGQINFWQGTDNPNIEKLRNKKPVVLARGSAVYETDKEVILKALLDRYYPERKI